MNYFTEKPLTHPRHTATPLSVPRRTPLSSVCSGAYHAYNKAKTPIQTTLYLAVFNHLLAKLLTDQISREILPTTLKCNVQFQTTSGSSHLQHNDVLYLRLRCRQLCKTQHASMHTLKAYAARIHEACFPSQNIEVWWFIKRGIFLYQVYQVCRCISLDNGRKSRSIVLVFRRVSE